jgi:hypothetical protein
MAAMATKAPTTAAQLERFNRWMRQTYPKFAYTQTQAEQLLRDYRTGRASLPAELVAMLTDRPPAPKPTTRVLPVKPTRRPAPKPTPRGGARRPAPKPTPRAEPPAYTIRPEARPSSRAEYIHVSDEDDEGDDQYYDEEDIRITPMGTVEWLENWGDYGSDDSGDLGDLDKPLRDMETP